MSIDKVLKYLKKQMGDDVFPTNEIEYWETQWRFLNDFLGGKGIARGRIIEVSGRPQSGKSTLGIQLSNDFLVRYPRLCVLYHDFEKSFDHHYAEALGLDHTDKRFIYTKPTTLEEGFKITFDLIKTNKVGLIVADSIHAMTPNREMESDKLAPEIALQARRLGEAVRKMVTLLDRSKAIFLALNHVSQTIGSFMPSLTTPGGRALKHYSTYRIRLTRKKSQHQDDPSASSIKFELLRNKVHPTQYGVTHIEIAPSRGFCPQFNLIEYLREKELLKVGGPWYTVTLPDGTEQKLKGKQAFIDFILESDLRYE